MIKVVTPTDSYYPHNGDQYWFQENTAIKVFLAGTIDNGDSENWQDMLIENLLFYNMDEYDDRDLDEDFSLGDLIIYNPRRENWDKNSNQEEIEKQIVWEQEHLEDADIIIMNILPNSKSPISLLELGLYGQTGKMIVFCSNDFYRYTNVKLTCERYIIPLVNSNDSNVICDELNNILKQI